MNNNRHFGPSMSRGELGTPICESSNYGGLEEVADGVPPIDIRWFGDFIGPIPNPLRPPETLSCAKAIHQKVSGNRVYQYWSV